MDNLQGSLTIKNMVGESGVLIGHTESKETGSLLGNFDISRYWDWWIYLRKFCLHHTGDEDYNKDHTRRNST